MLKILGGKHMVPRSSVQVLGSAPFHDTGLTASGELSYIGGNWERDVAFAGYSVPLQVRSLCSGGTSCLAQTTGLLMKVIRFH